MNYPHDTTVVTDAKGQVYRSDMNALGWATTQHHPDGTLAAITNRYDKGGRLTSTTNRRGQMITLTYDALGRVLTRSDPVSGTTSFSYSPGGFRTVASNATVKDSTMSLLYCQTGQYSISYACNSDTTVVTMASNPAKHYTMGMTAPGAFNQASSSSDDDGYTQFESKFSRNSLGLADSVTLGPLTMKYVYDPYDGLLTTTSLPNTSTRTDQYTTNNEEYNWTYTDTTINPLYRRSYRVDLLGRVTSEQMGYPYSSLASSYQLNREAAYDSLGHVSQVDWSYQSCMAWPGSNPDSLSADQGWRDLCSPSAIFSESYSYDAVGNRTDADAAYDLGNRLTSVDWATYVYDADGNVTSRTDANTGQLMKFFWDAGSQLDSVQISGGGSPSASVEYRYDPYGRLIMRTATDSTPSTGRLYVYGAGSNSSNIMKEVDLVTGNTTEYEYASVDHPTMSVTRDSAGTVLASRTYMMDGLGNVVGSALDASTGAAILYDSWGNIQTDSTAYARLNTLRFGFKGMLYDETTGLYNARARWYQPDVGRFMSEDPTGLSAGVNQYVYAGNDPIDLSDPTGLYSCADVSINATDCEDPLQFPGSSSYTGGAYGGGVSFAGGFGSINPGPVSGYSKGGTTFILYPDGTIEVRAGGDPNWRNNNPGNLRPNSTPGTSVDAVAQMFGAVGVTQSDFFIFGTSDGGWMALVGMLGTPSTQSQSIGQYISSYASALDHNDPVAYAASIQRITGFAPTTLISALDGPELLQLAATISSVTLQHLSNFSSDRKIYTSPVNFA